MIEGTFFLEISLIQGCFHIAKIDRSLELNLRMFLLGNQAEYVPIFMGSYDECRELADKLEDKLNEYTKKYRESRELPCLGKMVAFES